MKIRYGKDFLNVDLEETFFDKILEPSFAEGIKDPVEAFRQSLENPINSSALSELLKTKQPRTVAVIVEDKTRKNPEYHEFLKIVIDMILSVSNSRIYLIVAYGTHSKHTKVEQEFLYGRDNLAKVTLIDHDSKDINSLKCIGKLSSGSSMMVNRFAAECDFVITFGTVSPHAFAGFTGGRKAILPGISSYDIIRKNHAMVCCDNTNLGILKGNPIHNQMEEAAKLMGVDFSVQVVRNNRDSISGIYAGDIDAAFLKAVDYCRRINSVTLDSLSDVVFVSCGGHPKDKSLYQSQRAITTAVKAVKPGGIVVVFAEFSEGVGNDLYYNWLKKPVQYLLSLKQEDIDLGVHSAYLTARNLGKCTIVLYSDIDTSIAEELHLIKLKDINEIKELISKRYTDQYTAYFIPNGSEVLIEV